MNYVGSISILDRGDAPAQAVIDRNARSLAQRMADETRDELNQVMTRVNTIYGNMESVEDAFPTTANMEYLNEIGDLENILKDEIKKRQYQQQVTVFIVGYQDVCFQKLTLLQQVNEFFMENSKRIDDEDWFPSTPDIDLDEMSDTVQESLDHAHNLTNRLGELNKEMVEYMAGLAERKASNNKHSNDGKGRKKIEKALNQAKEEVTGLNEKLLTLQSDVDERDKKNADMVKLLDSKNMEVQKFRTAAELAKKKIDMLQKDLDAQKVETEEIKTGMNKFMDSQVNALHESHRQDMDELRRQYADEAQTLKDEADECRTQLAKAQHELVQLQIEKGNTPSEQGRILDLDDSRQSSQQESRPTTKDTTKSGKSLATSGKQSKSPTRRSDSKPSSRGGKDVADLSTQDDGGDSSSATVEDKARTPATRNSRRAKSNLAPVQESDFDSAFDLMDDQAWAAVPADQVTGRFGQYRRLSIHRLEELEEALQLTVARTKRKVATLKVQFQEHKGKWEAERKILIEQVDQSLRLQTDAEKEADTAMTQLEDFICEQEKLETEEEVKRSEVLNASASLTPQEAGSLAQTPGGGSPNPLTLPGTPEAEHELQRLMQQTDDAKVQEMNARLGSCVSAPPAVEVDPTSLPTSDSLSSMENMKIDGATEEEIRTSSAMSRASLRENYKHKLEEGKSAAHERRAKSPHIQLPTKMTVDDELVLDEEDDDCEDYLDEDEKAEYNDYRDPSMYEAGTNYTRTDLKGGYGSQDPIPIQRIISKGHSLLEHPLLMEYLKAYESVVGYKDGLGKMFLDKDMMSAHQITSDLETLTFDNKAKVMPQIEELTKNMMFVLDELSGIVNTIIVNDRDPMVSSLNFISREPTKQSLTNDSATYLSKSGGPAAPANTVRDASISGHSGTSSHRSERPMSVSSDKVHIRELQGQYEDLKKQLEADGDTHQGQMQRNTVVMMEMQDTINDLQRELSALGKSAKRNKSSLSSRGAGIHHKSPSPETSVMFTRLDSERNAKIMKKAVMEEKLEPEVYKEAVSKMDEYVSLPAQRLAHLVKKYVHHTRMREIEEKVKNSKSLNEEVFGVLDKMETLQNQRARQWAERMDEMGMERLKLANLLMNTLDGIEAESGIFLIKPMYSYRGRDNKPGIASKLSRPARQHRTHTATTHMNDGASSFIPAPTPASNYRLVRHERYYLQQQQQIPLTHAEMRPVETRQSMDEGMKVGGSGMMTSVGTPRTTWNMQASQPLLGKEDLGNQYNTPRILELDINRMLIGQNNISSRVPFPPTEDRLVNARENTLRSYVTVNRPTAPLGADKQEKRPTSGTPRSGTKRVRVSDIDSMIPAALPIPSPLPPITPLEGEEEDGRAPSVDFSDEGDENEPPTSPPGSSMYHSKMEGDSDNED